MSIFLILTILVTVCSANKAAVGPGLPELLIRKIVLEDPKTGTTSRLYDLGNLDAEGNTYFHKRETPGHYRVDTNVQGFVVSCRAGYPVYWNFNQDEGGPVRDKDSGFILYTERNASIPSTNDTDPVTNNFLANIQVVTKRSEFTGAYSCHSVSNPQIRRTIFLFVKEKNDEEYLVYKGQHITLPFQGEDELTLPCLVNSPVILKTGADISLQILDGVDIRGKEAWSTFPRNGSIAFEPAEGFQLKTKDLPGLLGRYRCVVGSDYENTTDFVNITIIKRDDEPHFDEPWLKSKVEDGAAYEFKKWPSSFYEGREAADASCCSTDGTTPVIYESECYNPANCLSRRKLMATNKLTHGPGSDSRGYFRNCTSTSFVYDVPVGHVFKCFGKGVYVMAEFFPSLVTDDKEEPWARFHTYEDTVGAENMLSLRIKITDLNKSNTEEFKSTVNKVDSISETGNQTMKLLVVKCHYVEYFISDGLYWKLMWKNGTIQWVKGLKSMENDWTDYYRLNSKPFPIELRMQVNIDELTSISCHGPKWNSTEWASVTNHSPWKAKVKAVLNLNTPKA